MEAASRISRVFGTIDQSKSHNIPDVVRILGYNHGDRRFSRHFNTHCYIFRAVLHKNMLFYMQIFLGYKRGWRADMMETFDS
jgi:hypothetical protein